MHKTDCVYLCVRVVLQWAACGGTEGLCMMASVGGLRDSPWKTTTSQGHFPSRGSEMCECVRENACGSFYILLSKYILFSHKQLFSSLSSLCIISQMLWVGASWSGHNGALCYGLWCPVLALTCFLPQAHNRACKSHLDWIWSLSWCFSSSWFCSVPLSTN